MEFNPWTLGYWFWDITSRVEVPVLEYLPEQYKDDVEFVKHVIFDVAGGRFFPSITGLPRFQVYLRRQWGYTRTADEDSAEDEEIISSMSSARRTTSMTPSSGASRHAEHNWHSGFMPRAR